MIKNSTSQKTKPEPIPEAVSSVILGIVSILAVVAIIASKGNVPYRGFDIWDIDSNIILVSVKWGWLFSIIGLILGILGMKSSAKKLAISGIVLSAITLLINLPAALYLFPR